MKRLLAMAAILFLMAGTANAAEWNFLWSIKDFHLL